MLCPVWLLAVAMVGVPAEVSGQCWQQAGCQDLSSESNILECIQLCRSDLTAETPIFPGDGHLQPPSLSDSEAPASALSPSSPVLPPSIPSDPQTAPPQAKRSYSMEHFRWGKPVGRKRRPIKVYTNGVEEESAEDFPSEMRRELGNGVVSEEGGAQEEEVQGLEALLEGLYSQQEKKDGSYKMNHFRWSGPPTGKRYGGFMKSWDERSQKPLVTLFKNVINKNGQQ
nr:pro-opiomelanocortin A [Plecoglossus altivelis]